MSTIAVPVAVDGLVTLMRGRAGYSGPAAYRAGTVPVFDGLDTRDVDARRSLVIGSTPLGDPSATAASSVQFRFGATEETFLVGCSALAWTGDTDDQVSGLRAAVGVIVADLTALLTERPGLGGLVADARIARTTWRALFDPDRGALVAADMAVRVISIAGY